MTAAPLGREPSRLPKVDLASAFGPPDRATGLAGRLRKGPATPSARRTAVPPPAPASEPDVREDQARPRQADRRAQPPTRVRPLVVIVYLPVSLRDRLRQSTVKRSLTYTSLVLEALDATHDRLDVLLSGRQTNPRPGSLFTGPTGHSRPRGAEPQVQVSLRLTQNDLGVIDRLALEHQAVNRSALVATALEAYLDA